jgi:predicted RecA/RadA family phage recombinase
MATNQVSEGEVIQVTSAANFTTGVPVEIGELFGVPVATTSSGAQAALTVKGEFSVTKQGGAGVAFAQGDPVYWDSGNNRAVATPNAGFSRIGVATDIAADAATSVNVLLDGSARPEEYITSSATLQGLGAAGAATTTRTNVPIWTNKTGRSVKLIGLAYRQAGPIQLATDTNDKYTLSFGKTGAVSVVASVVYDDSPVLPAMTVLTDATIITAASADVFTTGQQLFSTWECELNDAAKQMPNVEVQFCFQVL